MAKHPIQPAVEVRRDADGSYVALGGRDLPLFVAAPTLEELWGRIVKLQPSIQRARTIAADAESLSSEG